VSGGTTLMLMADLQELQVRALVDETDIGRVKAGQPAQVSVEAYPGRTFRGSVSKIEPQAVVQQSVTMFPVLVSIGNEQGLLLPGMNGEVSVLVDERLNALAVPVDAVRTAREIPAVATALGLDADSVRAQVERQVASRFQNARRGAAGDTAGGAAMEAAAPGRRGDSPGVAGGGSGRGAGRWRSGGGSRASGSGGLAAGRDPMHGRSRGGFGAGVDMAPGGGSGGFGAGGDTMRGRGAGGGAGRAARVNRAQVAFVRTARGLEPRVVELGISNFDYAEVLGGLEEGEEVALLSVAELQAKRAQDQSRIRQRMGSGLPGSTGGGAGRGAGGR